MALLDPFLNLRESEELVELFSGIRLDEPQDAFPGDEDVP